MPGNQGGSNWGSTAGESGSDGSVYVIGFNVPTIIRLLKAGRACAPDAAVRRRRVVTEGRYVTEGFGLYPTIVSPPYTTLTAYDLNQGTIRWQVGLGDDLRLVWARHQRARARRGPRRAGIIPTATGLLFVTAADRKVHVYDSSHGQAVVRSSAGRPHERLAVDVRARRAAVPARYGGGCGSPRRSEPRRVRRTDGHRGLRAAKELTKSSPLYAFLAILNRGSRIDPAISSA